MAKSKCIDHILIQAWMCSADGLHLKCNSLDLYALIYSFNNANKTYYASMETAAKWLGVSAQTINNSLKKLTAAGLIEKKQRSKNGAITNYSYDIIKDKAIAAEKQFWAKNADFEAAFLEPTAIELSPEVY